MSIGMIRDYRRRIEDKLSSFLDEKSSIYSEYSPIHERFYNNLVSFIKRGGKRLRPILMVLGYESLNDHSNQGDIFKAACSVELLHTSTLIHDDLVDRDEIRRGGPTFHVAYRNECLPEMSYDRAIDVSSAMAILGGNIAWNLGIESILEAGFPPKETNSAIASYSRIFTDLVNGVMLEESMSSNDNSGKDDYLLMVAMKTSTLIANSLKMGIKLGGGTPAHEKIIEKYGLMVGQAFQIRDDILGTFGKKSITGKPADSDIRWGKKTLLVIYAQQNADEKQKALLNQILGNRKASEREVNKVRQIFIETGALSYAKNEAKALINETHTLLDSSEKLFNPRIIKHLHSFASYSILRQK